MLEPGQTFGRYRVEALLGQGGMGQVYRAQDTRLGRRVALKILRSDGGDAAQRAQAGARMLREARAAAAFEHPNAVHVYDVGDVDGETYLAMEFIPGRPLQAYVGDATIPWETRLRWLVDVAQALAAAHDAGLVHRDVKPQNVMVRDDGRVKVLDFGLARRASAGGESGPAPGPDDLDTMTTQGIVLGTPQYMPPEQLAGVPLDGRTDQFAWGVLAYELLAGTRPFPQAQGLVALVTAILSTTPAALDELVPGLPRAVAEIVARALAKLPDGRHTSMHEVAALLEPYAAPPAARTSAPQGSSSAPVLPASASGAISGGLSASPPLTGGTTRGVTRPQPSIPATPPARRGKGALLAGGIGLLALGVALTAALTLRQARPKPGAVAPAPSASASTAATGISLMDLPMPASQVPAALLAYRRGLQAEHDANDGAASEQFLEALRLDPGLGAAHLRWAIDAMFDEIGVARGHFNDALQLRGTLGEHDQLLLDAFEPIFHETPPNWASAERKLEAATAARPRDAELWSQLAWVRRIGLGKLPESEAAQDAALALDPHDAPAIVSRIETRKLLGDLAGAIAATDACLAIVPAAASCLERRSGAYVQLGRCAELEQDARRTLAIDPGNVTAFSELAEVYAVLGRPVETSWQTVRSEWKAEPRSMQSIEEGADRAWLAVTAGDLGALERALGQWHAALEGNDDRDLHSFEVVSRVEELLELGELDRAAKAADDFLRRREAWTPDLSPSIWAIANDREPLMREALLRAGKISRAEFTQRRAAWIDAWRRRLAPRHAGYVWLFAYAEVAATADEAAEALAALADFGGVVPPYHPMRRIEAHLGRLYQLTGRAGEALESLERAARECSLSEAPYLWIQTSLWLGEARQAMGQKDAACDAYASVARRWAGLGPRSTTLKQARRHLAELGCPRP